MEEIFVPASGMAMEDVLFTEWLKQPGDAVEAGEPVAVVETDKPTVELSGTTAGTLSRHLVEAERGYREGRPLRTCSARGKASRALTLLRPQRPEPAVNSLWRRLRPDRASQSPRATATGRSAGAATEQAEREPDGRHRLSPRQRRAMAEMAAGKAETAPEADSPPRRFVPQGLRSAKTPPPVTVPVGRTETTITSVPKGRGVPDAAETRRRGGSRTDAGRPPPL